MAEKAIVCFYGRKNSHPLNWLLHKDFTHCFACLTKDGFWIQVDQVKGQTEIKVMTPSDFDLANYYRNMGYTVVDVNIWPHKGWTFNLFRGNILIANCVGVVKSALNINSLALTPYQLYKRLTK